MKGMQTMTMLRASKTQKGTVCYNTAKLSIPKGLEKFPEATAHDEYSASESFMSNSEEELAQLYML